MADGPSPTCDLIITNLHKLTLAVWVNVRVTLGVGPGHHYHQVDAPCPSGKADRLCMIHGR